MPKKQTKSRNGAIFDIWSIVHLSFGIIFGLLLDPVVAIAALIIWEPLEIFLLSPYLAKFNIVFGHESLRNSLSDIVFDTIGVIIGVYFISIVS